MTKEQFAAVLAKEGFDIEFPSSVVCDQHGAIMIWEWEASHRSDYYMAAEQGLGRDLWDYTHEQAVMNEVF